MTSPAPNVSCEPITLEAVKSKFYQWRTSRSKRSKVPECLWNDVRQLSKLYTYSRLSSPKRIGCSYQIISFDGAEESLKAMGNKVIDRFSWFGTDKAG
jgi:hypothetical protein